MSVLQVDDATRGHPPFTIGVAASGADCAGVTESLALAAVGEEDEEAVIVESLALEFLECMEGESTANLASEPTMVRN